MPRQGETHCRRRCVSPRCKGLSKKSAYKDRCCRCTRHPSGLCHSHRAHDGPQSRTRGPDRAAVVGRGVEVRPSTLGPQAGNGLFATIPFVSGDVITLYDGTRLRDRAHARSQPKQTHIVHKDGTYVSGLRRPVAGRGGGSFVNDGGTRRANAVFWNAGPAWNNDVYLRVRAGGVIRPGEEILCSYGTRGATSVAMGEGTF